MRILHCFFAAAFLSLTAAPAYGAARTAVELGDVSPARTTPIIFVDALKQSTPWRAQTKLATTVDGDVTSLARGQVAQRVVFAPGQSRPAGDYTLLYTGRGTFAVDGASIVSRSPGRIVVRVSSASSPGALALRLTATDAADAARNVRLILPGFEATYSVRPFYPPFLASLAGADVLRFSQWSHAATLATSQVWPLRPRVSHVTQADDAGVAPEYAIALANQTGADPWFVLPMGATDAYVYGVADLAHRFLDPRLHPTFEYGDRVWDQTGPANAYARMAAQNVGIKSDPASAAPLWYVQRSRQVFSVVDRAFGPDAARVDHVTSSEGIARSADGATSWHQTGATVWTSDGVDRARVAPSHSLLFSVGADTTPQRDRSGRRPLALHITPSLSARVQSPALDGGQRIAGALGEPVASVDVSNEGAIDWVVAVAPGTLERKAARAPSIDVSFGGARITHAPPGFTTLEWSDGLHGHSGAQSSGIAIGAGSALRVFAPADSTPRVLRIYVGAASARAAISANVDGASYSDASLSVSRGAREAVYTLVYRARVPSRIAVTFAPAAASGSGAFASFRGATLAPFVSTSAAHVTDETTYHNDLLRTGWNQNESALNTTNVSSNFGMLTTLHVDGNVLAQPLFLSDYRIINKHNIVIVATEHDSIYEFDADSGAELLKINFGKSQSSNDVGCLDIRPEYGITSTPVIDRATHTLFVVVATEPNPFEFHTTLHALDIATLKDKVPPVEIAASTVISNGTTISFDPQNQMSRTSLALSNQSLYLGIGSHCDSNAGAITGWILRYDFSLNMIGQFATVEDSTGYLLSSVWMTGFAPSFDKHGNVYVVTGNGAFDLDQGGKNYGESVLRVRSDLSKVTDYFTPSNWQTLNGGDIDFGSGGIMSLPAQQGPVPDVAVTMGKFSTLYLLDRKKLGRLRSGDQGALQKILNTGAGVWGGPAYYSGPTGQFVYYQAGGAPLSSYAVGPDVNGVPHLTLSSTGSSTAGYGGSLPVVSSNGQLPGTGVVWLVKRSSPLRLEAYDATDVSKLLFSDQAGSWSNPQGNGFVTPLVAAGKVYVPATGTVTVFGLGGSRNVASRSPATSPAATIHQVHGVIVAVTSETLTLRLRDGRLAKIDIRQARAARHTGALPVGGAVVAYGPIDRTGVFRATSIGHTSPNPKDWTPDE